MFMVHLTNLLYQILYIYLYLIKVKLKFMQMDLKNQLLKELIIKKLIINFNLYYYL